MSSGVWHKCLALLIVSVLFKFWPQTLWKSYVIHSENLKHAFHILDYFDCTFHIMEIIIFYISSSKQDLLYIYVCDYPVSTFLKIEQIIIHHLGYFFHISCFQPVYRDIFFTTPPTTCQNSYSSSWRSHYFPSLLLG